MAFSRPFTPPPPSLNVSSGQRTPPDQEMSDQSQMMLQPSPRPSLPSSIADFALSHASSSAPSSPSASLMALDDPNPYLYGYLQNGPLAAPATLNPAAYPLFRKIRRPSLLGIGLPKPPGLEFMQTNSRMNSPLISSFTSPFLFEGSPTSGRTLGSNRNQTLSVVDADDDLSPELLYESSTPADSQDVVVESPFTLSHQHKKSRSLSPSTPPSSRQLELDYKPTLRRSASSINTSATSTPNPIGKTTQDDRLNVPGRPAIPRLLTIMTESNLQEAEVKSEASFQRLLASHAELPPFRSAPFPRTPRSRGIAAGTRGMMYPTERGRFPEEALVDDDDLGNASTDEEGEGNDTEEGSGSQGINMIAGGGHSGRHSRQPSLGMAMSLTDDSMGSLINGNGGISAGGSGESLGRMLDSPAGMDLDMSGPVFGFGSPPIQHPMSSASTPSQWRHTPPPTASGSTGGRVSKRKFDDRYDPYPQSKRRAVSPAVSMSGYGVLASPGYIPPRSPITIARPLSTSATSSPILRPVVRLGTSNGLGLRNGNGEEKEVQGAGDGVGSLKL